MNPIGNPGPVISPASIDRPTLTRVVARLYLPVEMGATAGVMAAIAKSYPSARLKDSGDPTIVEIEVTEPLRDGWRP